MPRTECLYRESEKTLEIMIFPEGSMERALFQALLVGILDPTMKTTTVPTAA